MTKEKLNKANEINHNIDSLKKWIKNASYEFKSIEFTLFSSSCENIVCKDEEIMNQVKDFIIEKSYEKIKKLEKEFENL